MAREFINWFNEGSIASRTLLEDGKAIVHQYQADRDLIMESNKLRSIGDKPRDLSFGRYLGSIPLIDVLKLQKTHPDLFSPDAEIARAATIKFFNSSEGRGFRVQKA